MRKPIYLDYMATTPLDPRVKQKMLPYLGSVNNGIFGNPASKHYYGYLAKAAVEKARMQVADSINCKSENIIWTSGATEANNLAIKGVAYFYKRQGKHIITSKTEHKSVLNTCKFLEEHGWRVTYLGVDKYGVIDLKELEKSITDDTILISIMAANNETGTIMPIKEIAKIAKKRRVTFHTDAVQYIGKMPFDVKEMGAELVSISAHKINGPKGVGRLYIKKGTKIEKFIHGGHHEKNRRAGTENVSGIVGFGKACEIMQKEGEKKYAKVKELRDELEKRIKEEISQVMLNGHPDKRLPNTLNMSFKYLEGESIILSLDLEGIAVSTGSACTSGSLEPSHVLKAMGVEPMFAQGSIRFSLSVFNTKEDIDYVVEKLPPIIERLRKMSPVYKEE